MIFGAEYGEYIQFYENTLPEREFCRLLWEVGRVMEADTTGVDGVNKLRSAFPANEHDAEAIRRCAYRLINVRAQIEFLENASVRAQSFVEHDDGSMTRRKVSSVSSGSESISYAADSQSSADSSAILAAVGDIAARNRLCRSIIRECLSGIKDDNGVNLLYMGVYPLYV